MLEGFFLLKSLEWLGVGLERENLQAPRFDKVPDC